jgi:hypothetical protein
MENKIEEIRQLEAKKTSLYYEIDTIDDKIKNIRKNCQHEYYRSSTGMYDDTYTCIHCLNTTERPMVKECREGDFWKKYNEF